MLLRLFPIVHYVYQRNYMSSPQKVVALTVVRDLTTWLEILHNRIQNWTLKVKEVFFFNHATGLFLLSSTNVLNYIFVKYVKISSQETSFKCHLRW